MKHAWSQITIVGQGLAGSLLAFSLLEKGMNVRVIDNGHRTSSSMVAAGMWNPLSFKKLHQSWMASSLIPVADKVYRALEKRLNASFYHPMDLVRIFPDQRAANEWDERSIHPELAEFIAEGKDQDVKENFYQPFGQGIINCAGWLDIPAFLRASREYFLQAGILHERDLSAESILEEIKEKDHLIVLATGWKKDELGLFNWLPLIPNKGEVLSLRIDHLQLSRMVNFGRFLIPTGQSVFRCGATYARDQADAEPTSDARDQILQDYEKFLGKPFELVSHMAGFRPTVPDRKPLIGFHPELNNLAIFNGFGSKGVMLIPFFANAMTNSVSEGNPLPSEVSIERYATRRNANEM